MNIVHRRTGLSLGEQKLFKHHRIIYLNMDTITINKQALIDLIRVKEDFDAIVESLELMGDKEFMKSYENAKEEIKKSQCVDWNAL